MSPEQRQAIHASMVRFADGERGAFRPVFDGLWPLLRAFASRALAEQDAEDAAQRALLRVFSRIVDLDRERDGVAWALTITAYEVMTIRKQRSRLRESPALMPDERADRAPSAEELSIDRDLRDSLQEAVGRMAARDQASLTPVLAGAAAEPGETARKRRFRALHRLRELWRKIHG